MKDRQPPPDSLQFGRTNRVRLAANIASDVILKTLKNLENQTVSNNVHLPPNIKPIVINAERQDEI